MRETSKNAPASHRVNKNGDRRGMHRYAAFIGFLVVVLALVGLVSIVRDSVSLVRYFTDDTALRTELYDYVEPMLMQTPVEAFDNINKTKQDAVLLGTFWRIAQDENIRILVEGVEAAAYELDDLGRMIVPIETVLRVWQGLFGQDAEFPYRTVGEAGTLFAYEYDEEKQVYHIPAASDNIVYTSVVESLTKKDGLYHLRVAIVPTVDLGYDYKGDVNPATPDKAAYFETYVIERTKGEQGEISHRIVRVLTEEVTVK